MGKRTIESQVAETILEQTEKINIDGREYTLNPPSTATLILASKYISQMPEVRSDAENVFFEVLRTAKDCGIIGKIVAVLILGAKRIKENVKIQIQKPPRKTLLGLMRKREPETTEIAELDYLAEKLLDNYTPMELSELFSKRIMEIGVSDFFGLTTSLYEANLLKRTREVETASGD